MTQKRPVNGDHAEQLIEKLARARGQLLALINCLPAAGGEDNWLGPRAAHLNPPLWEYGHIVWFQEHWCLRARPDGSLGPSLISGADALYDSSTVPHDSRWELPLPQADAIDNYATRVFDAVCARLHGAFDNELAYFAELCLYHELMHIEAWWMAFQYLGYAPPAQPGFANDLFVEGKKLSFAAGEIELGSGPDEGFIFDNEKWRHTIPLPAFDIDAAPLSQGVFLAFVESGGYQHRALWTEDGWAWRLAEGASHPVYWRNLDDLWQMRRFDVWMPVDPGAPMLHVNRFEAEACAAWLGRRLPDAAQWLRATGQHEFRWGEGWEWLREPFAPYPGFAPDPYRDYSQPWFHTHIELRGGGPLTNPHFKRPGFRNFYLPHRRDPFAGFRTASLA